MRVYLSLGTNLGDRGVHLKMALRRLAEIRTVRIIAQSDIFETDPVGGPDQPAFLNMAAEIETDLAPLELLDAVKAIEADMGRTDTGRWGPRVIDIDLILCGQQQVSEDRLTVPHPEFRRRAFVLEPLRQIAPDAVDPVTGKTVTELAAAPEAMGRVRRLECRTAS